MISTFVFACTAAVAVCTGICLSCLAIGKPVFSGVAKMAASCAFMAAAVGAGACEGLYGQLILAGLFFSWWGDLFLIFRKDLIFLAGLIVFFLAHVAYAGAFAFGHGVDWTWAAGGLAGLVVVFALIALWINPHLKEMRGPVYAYMIVITIMTALALGAYGKGGTCLIPVGAVLFYVSDLFVARDRFVAPGLINKHLGLPLYYGAQAILALSIAFV